MVNEEHLNILKQGVEAWNKWREENHEIQPFLYRADLGDLDFKEELIRANLPDMKINEDNANSIWADLNGANLSGAVLREAILQKISFLNADFNKADMRGAILTESWFRMSNFAETDMRDVKSQRADFRNAILRFSNLSGADLRGSNLKWADLNGADLAMADLRDADLCNANLMNARLVKTNIENANLSGCRIYGISAWGLKGKPKSQENLIITPPEEPIITVDNLEVAQFIYLLLNNEKIRNVIDTITSKVVLILGRFTDDRKTILDALRDELRKRNYLPVLFDFKKPDNRDMTETVRTLAHLARFVIADITEPRSIPQELQAIIPNLAVPVQPLLLEGSTGEYPMFQDLKKYHWVLTTFQYKDITYLLDSIGEKVIAPAEAKAQELGKR